MNGRLLFVAGGLLVVWTFSVLVLGAATVAGGVGLQSGPVLPVVAGSVVVSFVLLAYYVVVRTRERRPHRSIR